MLADISVETLAVSTAQEKHVCALRRGYSPFRRPTYTIQKPTDRARCRRRANGIPRYTGHGRINNCRTQRTCVTRRADTRARRGQRDVAGSSASRNVFDRPIRYQYRGQGTIVWDVRNSRRSILVSGQPRLLNDKPK